MCCTLTRNSSSIAIKVIKIVYNIWHRSNTVTDSGLMVLFLTQTNSYLRPFNFCKSTVSNFTVHFQVRKKYRPVSFLFLPKYICVIFLCNNESFFDTFQYFFLTCLSFFQFQIMKSSLTPLAFISALICVKNT